MHRWFQVGFGRNEQISVARVPVNSFAFEPEADSLVADTFSTPAYIRSIHQ